MKRKVFILFFCVCLFMGQLSIGTDSIEADSKITGTKFIALLMQQTGLVSTSCSSQTCISTAVEKGIVKSAEKSSLSSYITRQKAAVYLNRTDEYLNGASYDTELFAFIKANGRISDLSSVTKANRASVIKVFMKGIIIGDSNGTYSQSRKFSGNTCVTLSLAKTFINRLKYPSKRKKISPDGQLIRTTNLPSNAKSYEYILQSFPNAFYQAKFEYQRGTYGTTPVNLVDYASPVDVKKMKFTYRNVTMETVMDNYLEDWCALVEKNIETRFNVSYKTVGTSWINKLRSTYYDYEDATANSRQTDDIKDYVKRMKSNKVIVKASKVSVERSTLYNSGADFIRVYVKFKVTSCSDISKLGNVIYSDGISIKSLKKNVWKECYFDIGLGSVNAYSLGEDYAIADNSLLNIK